MNAEELQGIAPAPDAPTEEQVVTESEVVESESSTENVEDDGDQPKKLGGVAKRIDELTRLRREAERRAERLEEQNAELLRKVLRDTDQTPQQAAQPQQEAEPQLDQFETYEQYTKAVARWEIKQELLAERRQAEEREQQKKQQAKQAEFQSRLAAAAAEMPDYKEVALNPRLPVSDTMADLIREMDDGPKVLYALGQNPNEAARIASLPPTLAAVELGKFAVKASLPQPKTVTNAPPPVNPLSGGTGSKTADPDKMTADEWMKWRNQQLYQNR